MRTNSCSSFGSSPNLEDVSTVSTSKQADGDKELRKFAKFFTTRLIQILVQSRTNERFNLPCLAQSQNDWFNLRLDELGEVSAQIKRSITKFPPDVPQITIDFFLYTVDQATLPLESWSFLIDESEKKDGLFSQQKTELYLQLSTLLKSVMVAARMTPMHRYYVKKQSAETFVILYRIHSGLSTIDLGSEACRIHLGSLPMQFGSFKVDVAYRTRMEIDPTVTPLIDNADSFQKISRISPGTTPDSGHNVVAGSPMSFGGMSHFSTSPPSFYATSPPDTDSEMAKSPPNFKARSRTASVASEGDSVAASPKEKPKGMTTSQSVPAIPKGMPFANLLTISYTGTLFTLEEQKEGRDTESSDSDATEPLNRSNATLVDEEKTIDEGRGEGADNESEADQGEEDEEEEEREGRRNTLVARPRPSALAVSQQTVVEMSDTMKADEGSTVFSEEKASTGGSLEEKNDDHSSSGASLDKKSEQDSDTPTEQVEEEANSSSGASLPRNEFDSDMRLESDDDSFVKIPLFRGSNTASAFSDSSIGDLISSCKTAPMLESFSSEELNKIEAQLENFSLNQGIFDRFVSEVRDSVEKEEAQCN